MRGRISGFHKSLFLMLDTPFPLCTLTAQWTHPIWHITAS